MKYFVIGGSGFIGQHFKNKLGKNIVENLDIDEGINSSTFTKCNILNQAELNKIQTCKDDLTLIHLAAVHFDFQNRYFETNVEGTKNVLSFIDKNKNIKKYVFFSSVATYGDSEFGKDELSVQTPINDYGKSKLEAEKLIINWSKTNPDVQIIIVRPAVVFGEYNFGNVFNLIQQIRSKIFAIIGSGKNIKSIAYVDNLVDSVIFCLNKIKDPIFIYNYCDYPQKNVSEQSFLISSILGTKTPFKIPLWLTKFFTFPVDIIQDLIKKDLMINSMRLNKFTLPTYFIADKIRNRGFVQKISIEKAIRNTNSWIESVDVRKLRDIWFKKASKL